MAENNRSRISVNYALFSHFALEDQRQYYLDAVDRNRIAATQVNTIRAVFALLTGLASALAGLVVLLSPQTCLPVQSAPQDVSAQFSEATPEATPELTAAQATQSTTTAADSSACAFLSLAVTILLIITVVAPALGGAFGTLADLFQWDRLVTIYEVALENLEVADAKSPLDDMDEVKYIASFKAYAEGTLSVMRDETAQWGQVIRTPESLQKFIERELEEAQRNSESLPEEVQTLVRSEIEVLRASTEETNRRLDEMRALLAAISKLPDSGAGGGTTGTSGGGEPNPSP